MGVIRAKQILDYESKAQYRLTVIYRVNGLPLVSTKSIVIDLIDQNDCAPVFDSSRLVIVQNY